MKHSASIGAVAILMAVGTVGARPYIGPGFRVPDNDPLGASSTLYTNQGNHITNFVVTLYWDTATSGPTSGHTWIGDLVATLTFEPEDGSPARSAILFERVGATTPTSFGDSSDLRGALSLWDSAPAVTLWTAAAAATNTTSVAPGAYRACRRGPTLQYEPVSLLSAFGGVVARGQWTLHISDHSAGDTGGITKWMVDGFVDPAPSGVALGVVGVLASLRRRRQ